MKVIFTDTNVIFGLLRNICEGVLNTHSAFFQASQNNSIYISTYVIEEARRNLLKKFGHELTSEHIHEFLLLGQHLYIFASQACDIQTLLYVYDKDDAQILQDAIDVQADYLITQNTKDFDERKIFDTRGIRVSSRIPEELFL